MHSILKITFIVWHKVNLLIDMDVCYMIKLMSLHEKYYLGYHHLWQTIADLESIPSTSCILYCVKNLNKADEEKHNSTNDSYILLPYVQHGICIWIWCSTGISFLERSCLEQYQLFVPLSPTLTNYTLWLKDKLTFIARRMEHASPKIQDMARVFIKVFSIVL